MIKGTKSGTTLRSILSRMINPTERAAEVMEELGIQFYNTDGTMKSLSEIITTVNEKTSGLTEQQRNQALSTIYGQQALTGMQGATLQLYLGVCSLVVERLCLSSCGGFHSSCNSGLVSVCSEGDPP